jgi:hypothetical protein
VRASIDKNRIGIGDYEKRSKQIISIEDGNGTIQLATESVVEGQGDECLAHSPKIKLKALVCDRVKSRRQRESAERCHFTITWLVWA